MKQQKKDDSEERTDSGKGRDDEPGCDSDEKTDASMLRPAKPKIGESADNLKQREEWFQKRTGKK